MACFDFDEVVDRTNTNSLKFDFAAEHGLPADVLPLWVADMDFRVAPCITDALQASVDHGIYGYSDAKQGYVEAVCDWFGRRHGWRPDPEWLVKTPGVVFALAMAVRAFTEPGDAVIIQTPVYRPFRSVVLENDRTLVENPLVYEGGSYSIDFDDFERKVVSEGVRLFILCSPHNPVCRVWTREELGRLVGICMEHDVVVVADEIHCDFAFDEHPFVPIALAAPEHVGNMVVCTAPSKTFNLAGLQASNIFVPDPEKRARLKREISRSGGDLLNTMGLVACEAAYRGGEGWLDECRSYLRGNLDFLRGFIETRIPQIRLVEPEGTYFAWLDCSGLGLTADELDDLVVNKAHLWLDSGGIFGKEADQFQRVVLACPRATLRRALEQLDEAVNRL